MRRSTHRTVRAPVERAYAHRGAPDTGHLDLPLRTVRVLTVIDALHLAGAEKLVVTLARCGPSAGVHLDDVISLDALPTDGASVVGELERAGTRVTSVAARRLLDPGAITRLVDLIRRSDCDLVHAHLQYAVSLAPIAARIADRPAVCSFHHVPGPVPRRERIKERLAVEVAARGAAVVTVSEAQRRAFAQRYPQLGAAGWHVVPNGIDLAAFTAAAGGGLPADLRAVLGGRPLTAMIARLRDGKGHLAVLEAWPAVRARVPGAHLLLVGDGPLEPQVRARIAASGLTDAVTVAGARHDVPAIVGGVDLVVLPSDSEALPTALMEAAAGGTAVVATDVGGAGEVVEDGRTGSLVPAGDRDALATAIGDLLDDEALRTRMGARARQVAAERFDAARWTAQLAALYRDVTERDRRAVR